MIKKSIQRDQFFILQTIKEIVKAEQSFVIKYIEKRQIVFDKKVNDSSELIWVYSINLCLSLHNIDKILLFEFYIYFQLIFFYSSLI